jgi:hypothetical protein
MSERADKAVETFQKLKEAEGLVRRTTADLAARVALLSRDERVEYAGRTALINQAHVQQGDGS